MPVMGLFYLLFVSWLLQGHNRNTKQFCDISALLQPLYDSHTEDKVREMKVPKWSGKQLHVERSENECGLEEALIVA
jgi:hypothetical protein